MNKYIFINNSNFIYKLINLKTMRNLILTICLSIAVSLAYSQIHVTGPNGGNVGIGVTNPTQKLDVSGALKVRGNYLSLGKNAGTSNVILNVGGERSANGSASFQLAADKSNYPDWGFRFIRFPNGFTNLDHRGTNSLVFNCKDGAPLIFGTLGEQRFRIETNKIQSYVQAYKPNGGPWAGSSDKRLKKDISTYSKGLKEILSINPVNYRYNNEIADLSDETYVGVVAQEVQKVVPTMVKEHKFTDRASKKHEGYLAVDPNEFTYMLINSVKEQQQTIAKLESQLTDLTAVVKPNPLKDYTRIEYFIPQETRKAFLTVENMAGQLIQRIDITEKGKGFIELKLKDMAAGVYSYRLKVDGNTVDAKKMVVE